MPAETKVELPKSDDRDQFKEYRHPDEASFDKFVKAIDRAYHRPWIMFWRAVLFGIGYALGATIGVAVVFTVLFYALRTINFVPYIEDFQELIIPESIRNQLDKESEVNDTLNQQIQTQTKQ